MKFIKNQLAKDFNFINKQYELNKRAQKRWADIIQEMIDGFEAYNQTEANCLSVDEDREAMSAVLHSLALVQKWFGDLWW